jgi:hypothetical protein
MNKLNRGAPSGSAQALGYGGLIPFMGLALATWFMPEHQSIAANALLAYGATIVSFIGAIHWGLTMRDGQGQSTPMLVWGVVPSLIAWVALLLPVATGLCLLAVLLWGCFVVDRGVYTRLDLRAWLPMRLLLTAIASTSCIVAAVRLTGATL